MQRNNRTYALVLLAALAGGCGENIHDEPDCSEGQCEEPEAVGPWKHLLAVSLREPGWSGRVSLDYHSRGEGITVDIVRPKGNRWTGTVSLVRPYLSYDRGSCTSDPTESSRLPCPNHEPYATYDVPMSTFVSPYGDTNDMRLTGTIDQEFFPSEARRYSTRQGFLDLESVEFADKDLIRLTFIPWTRGEFLLTFVAKLAEDTE